MRMFYKMLLLNQNVQIKVNNETIGDKRVPTMFVNYINKTSYEKKCS